MIGTRIGSYEIVEELGRGTSTTSFLARDERGKEAVAKRLFDNLCADCTIRQRFLDVGDLSAKIRIRKNIAAISGQRSSAEGTVLLREYVKGQPLTTVFRDGTLNETEIIRRVVVGLCDALRALSARGVVHGGIHPGNVIVQSDGRVKLTDFGTSLAQLCGKVEPSYPLQALRYLSPEQWRQEEFDSRADIYSIGLIVYALLHHGQELFDADDCETLKSQIRGGCDVDCRVLAPAVHPNPSRRYQDINEFRERLIETYFPAESDKTGKGGGGKTNGSTKDKKADKDGGGNTNGPTEDNIVDEDGSAGGSSDGNGGGPKANREDGILSSVIDLKSGNSLPLKSPSVLCKVARDGRRQQRPFRLSNCGPGQLMVSVACVGRGISASPEQLDISPGGASNVIVNLAPESDQFTDAVLRWSEGEQKKTFTIKFFRSA